ncbi:hypothetical protein V8E54_010575 [Elaphomyces granulatus]
MSTGNSTTHTDFEETGRRLADRWYKKLKMPLTPVPVKGYISFSETVTKKRKRPGESVMLCDTRAKRFRDVPAYPGLRRFNNFSTVKQWTGVEQRAVSRQLIPVIASLLTGSTYTIYRSHDGETLRYMELALYQINQLKWVFSRYRTNQKDERNADGVDTSHSEVGHKHLVKENFARTNKRDDFEEQIIHHITRQINAKAMDEILLQRHTNTHMDIDRQLEAKVTRPSLASDLVELG